MWKRQLVAAAALLLEYCVVAITVRAQEPTVTLRQGTLSGIKLYTDSRISVTAYLGIPYAMPPVGQLRFAAPERHPGWERPLYASSFAPVCPQPLQQVMVPNMAPITQQDEDCLYLNVWTTDLAINYRNAPVVIFLEGEGFVSGSPSRFPAQDLAAEGIVIVSVAYRINVFGFFCLENIHARGNLGLLDQYLALLWVNENIAAFGGDPRSVTLMGHSAGAVSVMYHLISPRTANLFHQAIIMSGSILSPWTHSERPVNASRAIARSLGCLGNNSTQAILACMRTKSTTEILRAYETQYMNGNWTDLVLPVVDSFLPDIEQYLPESPLKALQHSNFHKIPILTGISSHEGAISVAQWSDLVTQGFSQLRQFIVNSVLPSVMNRYGFYNHISSKEISTLLQWQYVDNVLPGDAVGLLAQLVELYSDSQFKAPHVRQLQFLTRASERNAVYAYQFEQGGVDLYGKSLNITGAGHGSEFLFLFGPTMMQQVVGRRFTPTEDRLSIILKRLWAQFVRQGSLSSLPYGYGVTWRPYNPDEDNFVVLRTDSSLPPQQATIRLPLYSVINEAISKYRISLWNDLLPKLHNVSNEVKKPVTNTAEGMQLTTSDQPYRSAMYTLIAFVIVLLIILIICVVLLKRRAKERERDLF